MAVSQLPLPAPGLSVTQMFVHDLQVSVVTRPVGLRAGLHAEMADPTSGLQHAGEQWAPAGFLITPHAHPVWEIYLQVHGTTRWVAGRRPVTLRPGHLFAVPPGVRHHMSETSGGNHHFYFAAVDLTVVLARRPTLRPAWDPAQGVLHVPDGHALLDPFEQLTREVTAQRPFTDDGLTLAVDRLVLETSRLLVPATAVPRLALHPAVTRVRDLIDHDHVHGWTLHELADAVGLAPTYLAGLFTRELGQGPHQYLLERRIDRARQLLTTSELPITTIGIDLGFSSAQHFSRVFRQQAGCSPRAYRAGAGRPVPDASNASSYSGSSPEPATVSAARATLPT